MTAALQGGGPRTPDGDDRERRGRAGRAAWPALVVIVLAAAGIAQTPAGRGLLDRVGLSGHTDRFTALSFTRPSGIGQQTGDAIDVSFAVANHEGEDRDYRWTVSLGAQDAGSVVTTGAVDAADGATVVVTPVLPNPCHRGGPMATPDRQRITVALTDPAQSIGFWLACPREAAP